MGGRGGAGGGRGGGFVVANAAKWGGDRQSDQE